MGRAGKDKTATSVSRSSHESQLLQGRADSTNAWGSSEPGWAWLGLAVGARLPIWALKFLLRQNGGDEGGGGDPGKAKGVMQKKELRFRVWSESNLSSKLAVTYQLCSLEHVP